MPKLITLDSVMMPEPKFIVLAFVLRFEAIRPVVKLYETRSKEPFVSVKASEPLLKLNPRLHSHPTPFNSMELESVTPLVVKVNPDVDPDSVITPVYVLVNPVAGSVTLP